MREESDEATPSPSPSTPTPPDPQRALEPDPSSTDERAILSPLLEPVQPNLLPPKQPRRRSRSLQSAVTAKNTAAIKLILRRTELLGITARDISSALRIAAKANDLESLKVFAEYVDELPCHGEILEEELVWYGSKHDNLELVDFALDLLRRHFTPSEVNEFIFVHRTRLSIYNDGRPVSRKQLVYDLCNACEIGNHRVVTKILASGQQHLLESTDLDRAMELASRCSQTQMALAFFESRPGGSDAREQIPDLESHFNVSIRDSLKSMVSNSPDGEIPPETLQRIFRTFCEKGNELVVRYMLHRYGLDPNALVPDTKPSMKDFFHIENAPMGIGANSPPADSTEIRSTRSRSSTRSGSRSSSSSSSSSSSRSRSSSRSVSSTDSARAVEVETPEPPMTKSNQEIQEGTIPDDASVSSISTDRSAKIRYISPLQAALRGFQNLRTPPEPVKGTSKTEKQLEKWKLKQSKHDTVVKLLLEHGADPNSSGGLSKSPLQLASKYGSAATVRALVDAGARMADRPASVRPWAEAAKRRHVGASIFRELLESGKELSTRPSTLARLLLKAWWPFNIWVNQLPKDFKAILKQNTTTLSESPFENGPGELLYMLLDQYKDFRVRKGEDRKYGTLLQLAAMFNHRPMVELLLSRDVAVNYRGYYYGNALQAAARRGHRDIVGTLLEANASVQELHGRWETPVRAAIVGGHADVVRLLLDRGGHVRARFGPTSKTSLYLAVASGNLEVVKIVLAAEDAINETSKDHPHALILACHLGYAEMAQAMIDAGAPLDGPKTPPTKRRKWNISPLHAAVAAQNLNIVQMLLRGGAKPVNATGGLRTPLVLAASYNDIEIVRALLAARADTADRAELDVALMESMQSNSIEIKQALIESGATIWRTNGPRTRHALLDACERRRLAETRLILDVTRGSEIADGVMEGALSRIVAARDAEIFRIFLDYVPLAQRRMVEACVVGSIESVQYLLSRGLSADEDGETGFRPLHIAAWHSHLEIVKLLVDHGADIHHKHATIGTPLSAALRGCVTHRLRATEGGAPPGSGSVEMVNKLDHLLLEKPRKTSKFRYFVDKAPLLDIRRVWSCEDIVTFLSEHGAKIRERGPYGYPLHHAAHIGSLYLVKMFLARGAQINANFGSFGTALHAALAAKHVHVVSLLVESGANIEHVHPVFGTPLHHACYQGDSLAAHILLKHGADATAFTRQGDTALTLALRWELRSRNLFRYFIVFNIVQVILRRAKRLRVIKEDLRVAAEFLENHGGETLDTILRLSDGMTVSEDIVVSILGQGWIEEDEIAWLLDRAGGIGVTERMLTAPVPDSYTRSDLLRALLQYQPICPITPEILQAQVWHGAIDIFLDNDPEETIPISEGLIVHALKIAPQNYPLGNTPTTVERLWWRNACVGVTAEMLRAARNPRDLQFLLERRMLLRRRPIPPIPVEILLEISEWDRWADGETILEQHPLKKYGVPPPPARGKSVQDPIVVVVQRRFRSRSIPEDNAPRNQASRVIDCDLEDAHSSYASSSVSFSAFSSVTSTTSSDEMKGNASDSGSERSSGVSQLTWP